MKITERIKFRHIHKLIYNGSTEQAIMQIDSLLSSTSSTSLIKKCINLKVTCYLSMSKYQEAYKLYQEYSPYSMSDSEDLTMLKNLSIIYKNLDRVIESKKYENSFRILAGSEDGCEEILFKQMSESQHLYEEFMENAEISNHTIESLIVDNYQLLRMTEACVFFALSIKLGHRISKAIITAFEYYEQALMFTRELAANPGNSFCLITETSDEMNLTRDRSLVKALSLLGEKVYHIKPCQESHDLYTSAANELTRKKSNGNISSIYLPTDGQKVDLTKVTDLLKLLTQVNSTDHPLVVFGESKFLMKINEDVEMSKILEMYYRHYEEQPVAKKDCVLLGPYLVSISHIWGCDVKEEFSETPLYYFSLIIPVRNSVKYLRQTIETCLNQDFDGTYEILICDNSNDPGVDVKGLVDEIDHPYLRYIRTPFDLSLAKSFEFAYLNSRGKYLISLGSDDGVMKSGLSALREVIEKYPKRGVFLWDHVMYFWPEFPDKILAEKIKTNSGINELLYRGKVNIKYLIKSFALGKRSFLNMPNMYLVTCVSRNHIAKILNSTGKFEDGDSQDVYTGMVNLFLEDEIVLVNRPVVVAGNSDIGIGVNSYRFAQSKRFLFRTQKEFHRYFRYKNYYSEEYRKIALPIDFGDYLLYYREFLKVNRFRLREDYRDEDDILEVLCHIHEWLITLNVKDVMYLRIVRGIAKSYGIKIYRRYLLSVSKWVAKFKIMGMVRKTSYAMKNASAYLLMQCASASLRGLIRKSSSSEIRASNSIKFECPEVINLNDFNMSGIGDAIDILESSIKTCVSFHDRLDYASQSHRATNER